MIAVNDGVGPAVKRTLEHFKIYLLLPLIHFFIYKVKYGRAAPKPGKIIWINPSDVEYLVTPRFIFDHNYYSCFFAEGTWDIDRPKDGLVFENKYENKYGDRTRIKIKDWVFYNSMQEYLSGKIKWENTSFYNWANQNPLYDHNAMKLDHRKKKIDKLFDSMKREGYKTQKELQSSNKRLGVISSAYEEVMVNIGRNGEFYLDDGKHRFVTARYLQITDIPVRVHIRHKQWQMKRVKMAKANDISDLNEELIALCDHPDMNDVVPKNIKQACRETH